MRASTSEGGGLGGRKPPRTTCKICWHSVFEFDETVWVISPAPGLAHKECDDRKKK